MAHALQRTLRNATRTEQPTVGKILRREIANGEFGENNLCARSDDAFEFGVNDAPFGVDNALVLRRVFEADLGILLLGFELQLDIEQEDLGIRKRLWLLLETRVGKGLSEGDAEHELRGGDTAAGDLLDANQFQVERFGVELHHG